MITPISCKVRYLLLFFIFNISIVASQDVCNTAVDLYINPDENCDSVLPITYNGYTDSGVQPYGCEIKEGKPDWWGKFTATSDYTGVRFSLWVSGFHQNGVLIYSGSCAANMTLVECSIYGFDYDDWPIEAIAPTNPGETYYVRVTDVSSSCQDMEICVFEYDYQDVPDVETCGDNMGFEYGDFTNWEGWTGECCPIDMNIEGIQTHGINSALYFGNPYGNDSAVEPSQHTITMGLNRDPLTEHNVPVVAPEGGKYSVRLGNACMNSQAECINRTFTVTPENAGITYYYAVVLEDPDHEYSEQPRFYVQVYDQNYGLINCAQYEVVSGYGTGTWNTTESYAYETLYWKDWVPVSFDLTPQIGQNVTIKACTGDCALGAHIGYAYFDLVCYPLEPIGTLFCSNGEPIEICAPDGYLGYLWNTGETTQCITVDDPQEGEIYTITVTNVNGCTSVITDTLEEYTGQAMEDAVICPEEIVELHAESNFPAEYHWTSDPPGFNSSDQDISVTQSEIGIYYYIVEMIPLDTQFAECAVIDTVTVEVIDCDCITPPVPFGITPPPCCGDNASINYIGPGLGTDDETELVNPTWEWDIGGGTPVSGNLTGSGTVPDDLVVQYPCNSSFTVTLTVQNHVDGVADCISSEYTLSSSVPEELTCSATGTDALCYGVCDGTASVVANGGTGSHSFEWDNGAGNNSSATDLCGGITYTVTVSDANGCTCVTSVFIDEPPELILSVTTVDAQCNQSDGSATVSASGGTPGYSYQWDAAAGNQTTATASNLAEGTYTVTVTDENDCTATISATVNSTDSPELSISGTDVSCYGFSDGIVDLTVTGGTPGYSYNWSNGSINEDMNNVSPGDYSVTVTDIMGCTSTISITINEPPLLTTTITGEDVTCYGYNDGSVDLTVSGGTPGYTYLWSPGGETSEDIANLGPGTYSVTVTDANNCTVVTSYTVYEPPELLLTITSTPISTSGACDGTATVTPTGGTPGYTYLWDDPTQQTTQTATDLCTGTYCVTVTDANGCTNDICIYISSIAIEITGTNPLCYGDCDGTATVTVTVGDNPPFTYLWDDPAHQITATATGLCSGTYSVTVTDDLGITATASIAISQQTEIYTSISGTDILCYGGNEGTIDLEAGGGTPGYTYLWSPDGQVTQDLNGVPAGQYVVTVTDANQCTAINSIILYEPPELTSVISGTDQLCTGDEIGTVDIEVDGGTPPYTYFWQPTDETTQDIDSLPSGDYTVLITDDNGCTTTNSIIIDEPYPVTTQMTGTDVSCYGYTDGTAGVTADGGTEPYTYIWDTGDETQNISNIGVGTYYVTITDYNNCTATDNITISEPPELIVNIPAPDWICIGESATLTANASGGTPGYSYEWNNGIMDEWNNVSPDVTASYSVVVTDVNNCIANANVTVSVYGPLSIQVYPDDTICAGESATIYSTYSGGMGDPYTLILNGSTVIETPYTVSPSVTTVYEICVNDNCTTPQACDDVEIVVMPDPPVNFVADIYEGCVPLQVHFNEINQHEGQTYLWDFGDPWGSTNGYGKNPVHTFENPGIYDVSCTITSVFGCTSSWTWYEMIWVWPNPVAAFFPYPQVATIIEPYIYFENNSSTYYITNWTFGDGDSSNVIHPQHKYDDPGTYNVMLAVETEHGCVDTTWSEVVIQDIITFYAPTAFSPDFDNMNGLFSPVGHGIDPDNWHLMIYDRWGEKVWETYIYDVDEETGKVNHGWDGTIRGRGIGESAVYAWLVVYKDVTGAEHQRSGLVTLIR